jgi:hypothetical protein
MLAAMELLIACLRGEELRGSHTNGSCRAVVGLPGSTDRHTLGEVA